MNQWTKEGVARISAIERGGNWCHRQRKQSMQRQGEPVMLLSNEQLDRTRAWESREKQVSLGRWWGAIDSKQLCVSGLPSESNRASGKESEDRSYVLRFFAFVCLFFILRPWQQQPLLLGKDGKGAFRRHEWSQWNLFQRCTESYRAELGSSGTGSGRESFENSWILEKKICWPRDKAGGNSIKQATKVDFMKAKPRLHGWLWLIWKLRWRALLFWIRNREPLLPRSPSDGFLAVWAAAVGLYEMSWEGSSFLWSMPFISTWLFELISYPTDIIYCDQCGLSQQQQQTVFQFGRPEGPAWVC